MRDVPVFCQRPHAVTRAARWFARHWPGETFYAVKANPEAWVLCAAQAGGIAGFDVASLAEVRAVRAALPDAQLAFMHPIKPAAAIADSAAAAAASVSSGVVVGTRRSASTASPSATASLNVVPPASIPAVSARVTRARPG